MLDIPSISAVVAAVGVLVGVVYAMLEVRNLVQTRQTDLVTRLYSIFGSKEFMQAWTKILTVKAKNFKDYVKEYDVHELMVETFFEEVGVLLHKKLMDISLVDDLFTAPVKMTWEKMKPLAEVIREQPDQRTRFEWFEYLYNELQKREQRLQHNTTINHSLNTRILGIHKRLRRVE